MVELSSAEVFLQRIKKNIFYSTIISYWVLKISEKKGRRKVLGLPQSQAASHPRHKEEEETDKTKQAQIK